MRRSSVSSKLLGRVGCVHHLNTSGFLATLRWRPHMRTTGKLHKLMDKIYLHELID
jgi:hypothetical protein